MMKLWIEKKYKTNLQSNIKKNEFVSLVSPDYN